MHRLPERRNPNRASGLFLPLSHHFRDVRFWVCNASQRCSLRRNIPMDWTILVLISYETLDIDTFMHLSSLPSNRLPSDPARMD